MSRSRGLIAGTVAIALVVCNSKSRAQTCTGHASWAQGRMRAGANYISYSNPNGPGAKKYGADLGLGLPDGVFGDVAVMRLAYPSTPSIGTPSASTLALTVGYPLLVSKDKSISFCPVAGLEHQSGPNETFTFGASTANLKTTANFRSIGGSVGRSIASGETMHIIPFAAASYLSIAATATISGTAGDQVQHAAMDLGMLEGGVGVVIEGITVRPSIQRPFGLGPNSRPNNAYSLAVSWNFGR
jgi:hypothetical protein